MAEKSKGDTVACLVRDIDGEAWRKARARAVLDSRDMTELVRAFIRAYGSHKIDLPREPDSRRKPGRRKK
jgi:hypothetical protein